MTTDRITRRDFVEAVGIAAGASTLLGAPAIAAGAPANEKIRLGLDRRRAAGATSSSTRSCKQPDVEIVAVADVDDHHAGETAERIKKEKGNTPDTARDYRAMLDRKDLDAVIIATPDHWHALPGDPGRAGRQGRLRREAGRAQRRRGPGDAQGRPQDRQDHGRRHPAALVVALPEGRRDRPLGQARQGLLGPDLELREHQPRRAWASTPTPRRRRPSTTIAGSAPRPCGPSTPIAFHLLFRWFFDYAGGMMSDWGVHLNDIVALGSGRQGPEVGLHHRRHLHHRRRPRHARHHAGRLRVPRVHPDLLDAQGERPEVQRPRLRHPLLRHRRQPDARPRRLRGHPRQGRPALRHQARPRRSPAAQDRPQAREGQGRRRPGRARAQLPRLREVAGAADLRHRDRPPLDQYLPPRQHLVQAGPKLEWDADTEPFKNDAEANALLSREPRKGYELPDV